MPPDNLYFVAISSDYEGASPRGSSLVRTLVARGSLPKRLFISSVPPRSPHLWESLVRVALSSGIRARLVMCTLVSNNFSENLERRLGHASFKEL